MGYGTVRDTMVLASWDESSSEKIEVSFLKYFIPRALVRWYC